VDSVGDGTPLTSTPVPPVELAGMEAGWRPDRYALLRPPDPAISGDMDDPLGGVLTVIPIVMELLMGGRSPPIKIDD